MGSVKLGAQVNESCESYSRPTLVTVVFSVGDEDA